MLNYKYYKTWLEYPLVSNLTPEDYVLSITEIIDNLNLYFGFVKMTHEEITALHNYFISFNKSNPYFKICDMNRAIQLYLYQPPLNKITQDYLNGIFKRYLGSDEYKDIIHHHANITEVKQIPKRTKLNPETKLETCYKFWKESGNIFLNDGSVYEENLEKITEVIGSETIEEIISNTKDNLIISLRKKLSGLLNRDIRNDIEKDLTDIENNGVILKITSRKEILKRYFQTIELEKL